jgi:hypothetical protein
MKTTDATDRVPPILTTTYCSRLGVALLLLLSTSTYGCPGGTALSQEPRPTYLIGYTEGRNDIPDGQFANWVTSRACLVRADGTARKVLAEQLTTKQGHSSLVTEHRRQSLARLRDLEATGEEHSTCPCRSLQEEY